MEEIKHNKRHIVIDMEYETELLNAAVRVADRGMIDRIDRRKRKRTKVVAKFSK